MHQSEPVLHIDISSAVEKTQPCLLRMHSLPVHDSYANAAHSVSSAVKAVVPASFLKGPKRKVSLSNLFANKPSLKMKVHHRSRDIRQTAGAFIAEPKGVILSSPLIPLVRVRSRSAPFSEMSPIQESPHQGSQDNVAISISPPTASPTQQHADADLFLYPESATTVDVRFTLNDPVYDSMEPPEEPVTICFVGGSSDDSCCSSDSELQFQPSVLAINNDSDTNSPVLNETHPHPTVDEPIFPYPNRSPRSSAPMQLMDATNKSANLTGHSPANPATPGSRPSPCIRRSSDSEISVTPRRWFYLHLDFGLKN